MYNVLEYDYNVALKHADEYLQRKDCSLYELYPTQLR